jgi:two-component system NtrC family sensor kinase
LYDADARQFGSIITIPDMRALPDLPDTALYRSLDLRTVAVASLMRESQLVGTLNIAAFGEVRPITEDEVALLRGLADLAGVAIVNARQHERLQRRLQESEAMAAISRALNETLRLEDVFQIIVDAARQIIPKVERAVIHLLDEEKQALRPAAVAGLSELGRPVYTMRSGEGVAGQVMAEGLVINVGDIRADPRYLPLGPATHLRSLLVAPVQSGARRLGTISVQSAAPHVFSEDDEQLLAILGLQAALAIENARLFEVERRKAAEAEALRQVTQTLISRLKLSEVLNAVVEAIATIANYKYVSVFLLEDDQLVLQAQKGYDAAVHRALRVDQGVTGRVARLQRPTLVPDVTRDRDYISDIPGVQSAIGVPLIVGEQALGVLLVESDVDHPLDRSDLHWLTNAGRQLSVAIENTRLYDHLEKSLVHEKAARAQMVQTEKLAAMGRLVASVAHELNNPLQAIQNALYLVKQEQALSPQAREDLQVALTEADRLADLISRLRETYRPATAEQFRLESINAIVYDVQRLIGTHLRHSQITFEFDPDPELPLLPAIRDQLKQVILNLCLNAVEAMLTGGRLTVRTRYLAALGDIMVTIADTGTGIDPAALPNIFEPFFTTKEGGTGLGLVITYDIIQRHRGRIEVESEIGHGTTFKIWLPVDNNRLPIHNMASETHV